MDGRERLIEIMKSQRLNAKQFSERLGVSAGTISNIMSGRNKPSLELLQNIAQLFPFIQSDWLFLGKGDMCMPGFEATNPNEDLDLFSSIEENISSRNAEIISPITTIDRSSDKQPNTPIISQPTHQRAVQKIVIFYSDGTFEER